MHADYLDIPKLRAAAVEAIEAVSMYCEDSREWRPAAEKDFIAAMRLLYSSSAKKGSVLMKSAMLQHCLKNRRARYNAKNSAEFKALILAEPTVGQDWALGLLEKNVFK